MRVEDSQVSLSGRVLSAEFSLQRRRITFLKGNSSESPFSVLPLRVELKPIKAESVDDVRKLVVKKLLEILTGREIETISMEDLTDSDLPPVERPEFGAVYEEENLKVEARRLDFFAYGEVRTEDGRAFRFEVNLSLFDLEIELEKRSLRSGSVALVDPLVIDLDGSPDFLSPARFEFDINGDGNAESVPLLARGKGFIFFDGNENGKPDGGEIIGTRTGDAFSELRSLDEDRNGWVDGGDSSFGRLKVWIKNMEEDRVLSLSRLGVGALYAGSFETLFDLKGSGVLRNLGLYLDERGSSGILAKVDFRV